MDNIKYDLMYMGFDINEEDTKKFMTENPITHALLSHLIEEIDSMQETIKDWSFLTDVVLATAAYTFYRSGGTSKEFMKKLKSVDIAPDISKLN